ncbi:alpha/beta hydrolase family protein [Kineococcus sp. SYSU DK001]|uniref:alpha/beta hydrolase family protein n=1 Tax=Kineococcus sp. SYSU DK001 TaxID=3383122 RepID=UPI003D7E6108
MVADVGMWVAVLGAAGCVGSSLLRRRAAALTAGAVALAGVVVAGFDGGFRWQLVPSLLAVAVTLLALVTGGRRTAAVVGVVAVAAGAAAVWAFPPLRLPGPSGPHPVGVTEFSWTGPRAESGQTADCPVSEVVAQVWYPAADPGGEPAPYLGRDGGEARQVAGALADTFGVPGFLLREAAVGRGRAVAGTPAARGRFPVVLFSPGNLGVRRQNSAWATDLAGHGLVVVALDHPCDSAVVVGPDGRAVRSTVGATGDDARDDVNAGAQVTARARQLVSALDELTRQDTANPVLGGHLDLGRVAATGHSLGGAAALRAATLDDRIDAVVDVDGFPRGAAGVDVPVLVLVAGRGTGNPQNDAGYARAVREVTADSPDGRVVEVPGASHLTFTDAPLFLPPVPGLVGSLGRDGAVSATVGPVREFLADVLGPS